MKSRGKPFLKGHTTWNKGKKGLQVSWNKGKKTGIIPWNKGLHVRLNQKGEFKKGQMTGNKNPNWKGDTMEIKNKLAKIRDDYTCQICGLKDMEIVVVDHIRPKAIQPDLYLSLDNLQTLCPNCHARKTKIDYKNIVIFRKTNV
jgi:Zn finger protein HypA/HybF involved in hydrogenase expression